MRYKFTIPLILFCLLLVVFLVKLSLNPGNDLFTKTPMLRKVASDFSLPALSGGRLKSRDLEKKMVLVNFFASWCEACRYEQSVLMMLTKKTGVSIYGIAWKDNNAKVITWLKKFGNPYKKVGIDHDGVTAISFGITGVPETFLLTANGTILFHQSGPIDEKTYYDLLKLLKK
jgi:cytochrome c biogenesis protein CcmG, thiol:disulfide interchange protein DsbE